MPKSKIKKTHGGKRKGAGRKPVPYQVKAVKVPEPVLDQVKEIIRKYKQNLKAS